MEFKRGWGAYGKPLAEISLDDADHDYTPNGPMPPDFAGHLTLNVSNDGLVYAADRNANRIHVTTKEGEFLDEFVIAPETGAGGSTGGVAFRTIPSSVTCTSPISPTIGYGSLIVPTGPLSGRWAQWPTTAGSSTACT